MLIIKNWSNRAYYVLLGLVFLSVHSAHSEPIVINDNAAWCWYQDERAIISGNHLIVGSVASKPGTNGLTRGGNIEVATYTLGDDNVSKASITVLHEGLEDDDHNVPALLDVPGKHVLAVYSKHNTDRNIRYRIAKRASHFTAWENEVSMGRVDKITYANLMRLSNENDGHGRLYNFYRGINFNPTFDYSDDDGKTWSTGTHFIKNKGRPYVKYISNNTDKIHFVTTEQHPRVFDNSIYHGYFHQGNVYASDGRFIQRISDGPVNPNTLTKVYQGGPDNVAWTTDLHLDAQGRPYTVFTVQVNDGKKDRHKGQLHGDDMRYYYARWQPAPWWKPWQKSKWQVSEIAYAGSRLYDREQDYTGLAALNPGNPNEIVISSNANPVTGNPLISAIDHKRHWELFKGITNDNGRTWSWAYITKDSSADNLRPVIPINPNKNDLLLLWMHGRYEAYTKINTQILLEKNPMSIAPVK